MHHRSRVDLAVTATPLHLAKRLTGTDTLAVRVPNGEDPIAIQWVLKCLGAAAAIVTSKAERS